MTRLKGRIAASLFFLSVLAAVFGEFVAPGALGVWAVIIPIAANLASALVLCSILAAVNKPLALLALILQTASLAFEALRLQPSGVNVGLAFHGLFCLAAGALVWHSVFLPRLLGASTVVAGLVWLLSLSPSLLNAVAPANTAIGLASESALMLWLLVAGVKPQSSARVPPEAGIAQWESP